MRTFVIATGNENKVKEFYRMLSPLGYDVKSIKDLNIEIEAEETPFLGFNTPLFRI